ncbi:hypothetical protein GCM10023321_14200 [Pseudonocardia eucalypti]|uniref:Uncharacterized protein n=1 Tax=Pseudonocardia eucalypti TaxID=648755 RepID=A0ABP9PQT4_9PSEU|nr:hypothetical protein [Pseudonocardia eucalypti]
MADGQQPRRELRFGGLNRWADMPDDEIETDVQESLNSGAPAEQEQGNNLDTDE